MKLPVFVKIPPYYPLFGRKTVKAVFRFLPGSDLHAKTFYMHFYADMGSDGIIFDYKESVTVWFTFVKDFLNFLDGNFFSEISSSIEHIELVIMLPVHFEDYVPAEIRNGDVLILDDEQKCNTEIIIWEDELTVSVRHDLVGKNMIVKLLLGKYRAGRYALHISSTEYENYVEKELKNHGICDIVRDENEKLWLFLVDYREKTTLI